jgi:2-oxoglutarate dehydrogenase E1 component
VGADSDYGANEWLIAEMLARYEQDPDSVDPAWAAYFADGSVARSLAGDTASSSDVPADDGFAADASTASVVAPEPVPARPVQATDSPEASPPQPPSPAPSTSASPEPAPSARPAAASTPPVVPTSSDAATTGAPPAPAVVNHRSPSHTPPPEPQPESAPASLEPSRTVLRGAAMRTAQNMESSLTVPTATSVRTVPMKLAIEQRQAINSYLRRSTGGKISFTHLIGFAMVQALKSIPEMNHSYAEVDGRPSVVVPPSVNLGIAIDMEKPDGTRQLFVPCVKQAETMDFAQFWRAYEDIVKRARGGKLTADDFAGTTVSLTNPGGIGTSHSVPRLMPGQSVILGVGSIEYPPEFAGMSTHQVNELGVSKVTTLTSTYDHRVIQGAQSGEFLKRMHELLIGSEGFYDEIFHSLRVPYNPMRWATDISTYRADQLSKQARVVELINAYRSLGHLMADIDPLAYRQRSHPELEIQQHGLTLWDLDREFPVGNFGPTSNQTLTLRDILTMLRESYCRTMGVEFMHIHDTAQRRWFQERFERPHVPWTRDEHMRILDKLKEAEVFETFLQTKYVGQKRFSLEGGESAIVALDEICDSAAEVGLVEVCIGMPHRGRLNVLANIVGKSYSQIFREFDGYLDPRNAQGTGDVKYHLGAEGQFTALSGAQIKTSVAANPSHLEAVDPIVEGIARAKLDRLGVRHEYPVLPVLLHGDAAFAGQGVVYETLQMSQLKAYRTGGTIHLVVNNQIGFTTAPGESRSSVYCTDVAKTIQAPIFHVNGDDPEAVARTARMAFQFRQAFGKDVVIDLVCYRRRGHNEGDDPSFTQPLMYNLIEQKGSVRRRYTEQLIGRGDISPADADEVMEKFRSRLESVFEEIREDKKEDFEYARVPYYPPKRPGSVGTAITSEEMQLVADAHRSFPVGFTVHPKVLPQLERRAKSIEEGPIDWATAELLAFGSLLVEGRPVRLAGQDSRRGTFSQRFAAVIDRKTNEPYVPLKHLTPNQARFDVFDSLLSEYAAMGFEYGYSVAAPDALVLWEAQFGDFANGAQTIADEFIASGDAKWTQKSGVVLLLPHGYEGQGPDHSSARIERWLQLCSENALAVCQPSTPASYFHLLRTHAYVNWHRPVVVLTPKSMLRNKQAVSMPADFTHGAWQPAIPDTSITDPSKVRRVLLCSGKIRWELITKREEAGLTEDVAIIPLERLYPLPTEALAHALAPFRHVTDVRFVQDEPANQGAWPFLSAALPKALAEAMGGYTLKMRRFSRPASSAPSVGSHKVHVEQEAELISAAVTGE